MTRRARIAPKDDEEDVVNDAYDDDQDDNDNGNGLPKQTPDRLELQTPTYRARPTLLLGRLDFALMGKDDGS